jgi:hypothetical protein
MGNLPSEEIYLNIHDKNDKRNLLINADKPRDFSLNYINRTESLIGGKNNTASHNSFFFFSIFVKKSKNKIFWYFFLPRYYIYYKVCNRSFVKNLGHRDFRVFSTRRNPAYFVRHLASPVVSFWGHVIFSKYNPILTWPKIGGWKMSIIYILLYLLTH